MTRLAPEKYFYDNLDSFLEDETGQNICQRTYRTLMNKNILLREPIEQGEPEIFWDIGRDYYFEIAGTPDESVLEHVRAGCERASRDLSARHSGGLYVSCGYQAAENSIRNFFANLFGTKKLVIMVSVH